MLYNKAQTDGGTAVDGVKYWGYERMKKVQSSVQVRKYIEESSFY
jgi:hypothetical protein